MDKTPPRAGHPLDGAATRKVTGMPTGIPPEAARRALATRVLKRGAVSIPAYRWELSYWRWGRQHRVVGGIPILRSPLETSDGAFHADRIAPRHQRKAEGSLLRSSR